MSNTVNIIDRAFYNADGLLFYVTAHDTIELIQDEESFLEMTLDEQEDYLCEKDISLCYRDPAEWGRLEED